MTFNYIEVTDLLQLGPWGLDATDLASLSHWLIILVPTLSKLNIA